MVYKLEEDAGATNLTIIQEGPRPGVAGDDAEEGDEGNPVLATLKSLAESADTSTGG